MPVQKECSVCGASFQVQSYRADIAKYCSLSCRSKGEYQKAREGGFGSKKGCTPWNKGKKTGHVPKSAFKKGMMPHNFKGGFYREGYFYVPLGDGKHIKRARLIIQKHLGRTLKTAEIVHHINEIKDDDRIENLAIVSRAKHNTIHHTGK